MDFEALTAMAARGDLIAYFGYGSLVNPATHRTKIVHHERAQIAGFARFWQARPDKSDAPIALLSAAPSGADDVLDGLLVFDTVDNLPSLDEREAGYDRLSLSNDQVTLTDGRALPDCPLYVYTGRAPHNPDQQHHILQSYLDAVLQGYLHQYGEAGAANFVARTKAFDTPLLADRHAPYYPRAVALADDERDFIDDLIAFMPRV